MKSSSSSKKQFLFGSFVYRYDLIKQNRKTLSLTVAPDLSICVKSPYNANDERIELFLRRKWLWLEKQLSFFGKYQHKQYKREYISGESLHYLGRQYQLIVKHAAQDKVSLSRGILLVFTMRPVTDGRYTKKLVSQWYQERTREIFIERFEQVKNRFEYKCVPSLAIRDMKRRWGSFVDKNKIVLNPKLIYTSKDCIDYVIVHELCHVRYKNHNKTFFALLDKKYPRWEKVKEKLEAMGSLID
jgi:predicted metal-dependent hydrolase